MTQYFEIDHILALILEGMQQVLGNKLTGLYLHGSLVLGDFDLDISDIDLLAAVASDLDEREFAELDALHNRVAEQYPTWRGRIEIAYLSVKGLKTFRTEESQIAVISPGEPFHFKEAGKDWLIDWWVVRREGIPLYGPPASQIIDPISQDEFIQTVREQTWTWQEWIYEAKNLPVQAYAILTLCRALYAIRYGEQVSKKRAASWVQEQFPQWTELIQNAFVWRSDPAKYDKANPEMMMPETLRFIEFAVGQIVPGTGDSTDTQPGHTAGKL